MTRDPRAGTYDEAAIAQLVRDVAAGWSMPPVRLDAPAWRDRVRSPRTRRLASAGGWFGRLGQAATAAVALTVAGALIAVVLTRPSPDAGKSPEPSAGATPTSTPGAEVTPLPKVLVTGEQPEPTVILVRTGRGDFARVDLVTGSIDGPLTSQSPSSELRILADRTIVCLCVSETGSAGGMPTTNTVMLERYDAGGNRTSSTEIESFAGAPDPRDAGVFIPDRPAHVMTRIGYSADGRYGFVGWSVRAHPVWRGGVVVVDLQDGSIVSRFAMPDATDGQGDSRRVVTAPHVVGSIGGTGVLLSRAWYEWTPPAATDPRYTFQTDVLTATFRDGTFSDLAPTPAASGCGDTITHAGALPGGGFWISCTGGATLTLVRRFGADGSLLGDVGVPAAERVEGDPAAVSADGSSLYAWDAAGATLTRVDLATGKTTSRTGVLVLALGEGPLVGLGHWLAPTASAKALLRGAVVISPDGSRVYAIGVMGGAGSEMSGSTGVFVFDASTLAPLGTWQPTADYVSLAVSADGRFVYAAGLPGVDASGNRRTNQQASITVFDTNDGSVRLIAGKLGSEMLSFGSPTLD
jgi:hypothetical protein